MEEQLEERKEITDDQILTFLNELYPIKKCKYKLYDLIYINHGSYGAVLKSHELGNESNVVAIKKMHIKIHNIKEKLNLISL